MPPRSRLPVLLRDVALVLMLNSVVAVILTLFILASAPPGLTPETRNQVLPYQMAYSQAIGCTILSLIELPRLTWWWERRPGWIVYALVTAAAIPSGFLLGGTMAAWFTATRFDPLAESAPFLIGICLVTIVTSLLTVYFITQRERLAEEKMRAQAADVLAKNAQLQLLQQQIEPHMLFNTLANVHALIETEPSRAQQLLEALTELLHTSMQMNLQQRVSLAQEFALLRNYLQVMSMRMGARLSWSLSLPVGLEQIMVPPLLVQPLVENAVKHGLERSVAGGSIRVVASMKDKLLVVEVADDGLGLHGENPFASTRIGLANVRKRLGLAFGDRAALDLSENLPQGVRATLSIPL